MSSGNSSLKDLHCVPCKGGVSSLKGEALNPWIKKISSDWKVIQDHHLEKEFRFDGFRQALNFVNLIGELAEREGHHPDIFLSWGKVRVSIWTHKIDGLTENDFILADKCDDELLKVTGKACY